ncbi:MAG: hypothetical protein CM1200mP30_24560 [Pseudomonadota bacterium]|nr:MAG: hypothetical protein CM1200mP30_24560 [Pseudomonadota bacterium]
MQGPIHAFFFLVSPNENPGQHLRILAKLQGVSMIKFHKGWMASTDDQELKEILCEMNAFSRLPFEAKTIFCIDWKLLKIFNA